MDIGFLAGLPKRPGACGVMIIFGDIEIAVLDNICIRRTLKNHGAVTFDGVKASARHRAPLIVYFYGLFTLQ